MFLHIGEGKILNKKDIVGIFDLENTSTSKKTREFLRKSEKRKRVVYVSEEIPKTFIITKDEKVYISQISSQTLYKRTERVDGFGAEN